MGRQVNFFLESQEEEKLVEFTLSKGFILLTESEDKKGIIETTTLKYFKELGFCHRHYFHRNELGEVLTQNLTNILVIDSMRSPVIEFCRTRVNHDKKMVNRGRIWHETSYWNERDELVYKSKELSLTFDVLARWIRKNYRKHQLRQFSGFVDWPSTPEMQELSDKGYIFW